MPQIDIKIFAGSYVTGVQRAFTKEKKLEVDGPILEIQREIDDTMGALTLWTAGSTIDDFDFLWFETDASDVVLSLEVSGLNTWVQAYMQPNIPFFVFGDDSLASYDFEAVTGTADLIDKVRVRKQTAGSGVIHLVMVT